MSRNGDELQRLKSLRDRQLADRDPTVKKQEFRRQSLDREHRAYKPLTFKDAWRDLPHVWKGLFIGFLIGFVGMFILTSVWTSTWAWVLSIILILILVVIGAMIGNGADSRDVIKDNLR